MDKLLTLSEVAERLDVPPSTLRYWRANSAGPPAVKLGKHLRYRPEDVEAWLRQQASRAPAGAA